MARSITDEEARAEGLPDYVCPFAIFDDETTGRHAALVRWDGEPWLIWKHPDGQWVTWRPATSRDVELILHS